MKNPKKLLLLIFFLLVNCTLITGNSTAQWFTQHSGTTNPLYDIEFINKNTGWACGDGGYIIKTTNGGVNWIQQSNGVIGRPLFGIHPVDSNIVYAVGFFNTFIKSTNGGESWFNLDSGGVGSGSYMCVFFINENTGWISNFESGGYGIKKTTDGGVTLHLNYFNEFPNDLYFKDSANGIGVQASSLIFKTENGGTNWSVIPLAGSGDFYRVSFINDFTGYTASSRAVYKTTDFGTIWDSVGHIPAIITSVEFSSENTGWAGSAFFITKTSDGGKTWNAQVQTGVVYSIFAYNDSLVWTCGNGGRIWHTTNGGTSSIKNVSSTIPDNFELYQNYPNPFNPVTYIKFDVSKTGNVKLLVFDGLGKEIKTLVNENLYPGSYQVSFNGERLSSGIYFYRLSANGFSRTMKMILLK
jgi:photosystem II stability/assembly factor-like uncharacterized protein